MTQADTVRSTTVRARERARILQREDWQGSIDLQIKAWH